MISPYRPLRTKMDSKTFKTPQKSPLLSLNLPHKLQMRTDSVSHACSANKKSKVQGGSLVGRDPIEQIFSSILT